MYYDKKRIRLDNHQEIHPSLENLTILDERCLANEQRCAVRKHVRLIENEARAAIRSQSDLWEVEQRIREFDFSDLPDEKT